MNLEKLVQQANAETPPEKIVENIKKRTVRLTPPTTVFAFLLYSFTHQPIIVAAMVAALILYVLQDLIRLTNAAGERKSGVEAELPFTATLVAMAAAHTTPTNTLKNILNRPSLKNTAKEYYNLVKQARLNHTTLASAATITAQNHPSPRFQSFLRTISAAERGLGDPQASLTDLAKAELENTRHQAEIASEKLGVASSTVLMMFAVLPLTITVFSVIANQQSLLPLSYMATIPALLLVNHLIEQAYPQMLRPKTQRPKPTALAASCVALAATYIASTHIFQPQYVLAACLIAATTPIAAYYHRAVQTSYAQLLESLPHLSRDIAEEAKKGLPPTVALRKLLNSNKYPKSLRETLTAKTKPHIAQAYMDVLAESEKIGADPERLENIADTFNQIANTHSAYRSKSSFFRLTAYASAGILAAASVAVTTTVKRLAAAHTYTTMYSIGILPHFTPILQTQVYLGVILNSYVLGLLAGKAHKGAIALGLLDAVVGAAIATSTLVIGGLI